MEMTDTREILLLLHESPMYFGQLLELSGVSKNYLIGRLDYLIKRGYVSKEGKRGHYVYRLTDKGLTEAVRYKLHKFLDHVFDKVIMEGSV